MKKFLLAVTGTALLAAGSTAAMAQMPPPGGPQAGPPGGPPRDGGPPPDRREGWMHHGHHDNGAAFFRFRRGDAEMDIKCPTGETVQACVSAAGSLMDKVGGMAQPKTQ